MRFHTIGCDFGAKGFNQVFVVYGLPCEERVCPEGASQVSALRTHEIGLW